MPLWQRKFQLFFYNPVTFLTYFVFNRSEYKIFIHLFNTYLVIEKNLP